ncbi:hypothetical protein [Cryptosporangium sp. NPDC048952]|uniref:hypothetical protein n=1 Tax=Cryptosporangium sp. NPDC048952 TaxID=3363961 RepID=UPI003721485F
MEITRLTPVSAGMWVAPPTISGPIPMPSTPAVDGLGAGDLLSTLRDEENR